MKEIEFPQTEGNTREEQLVSVFLDIGELLLRAGAEVNRVEDTIRRIGKAYGFVRVEIFTINNMIALTVHSGEGKIITQTRRIVSTSVNLEKVANANALSRSICASPIPLEELRARVGQIDRETKEYKTWVRYFAFLITAASFTVFFGGAYLEAAISGITSLVLCTAVLLSERLKIQPIIANLLNSFIMTAVIAALTLGGKTCAFDTVIMGNIMLLIPGIELTTSIRDLITGDTISGLMGICDALLKAFAIAVGCAMVLAPVGMI